ncbi:hypothetical protein J3459_009692 [Metarhizium acridum]|uniref:Aldolase n=1 Tax=Metarhizium acridum (strain CQMa 102) TaxID=655827 RepID=E9ED52_METAQ|nr:aldolase [Metarhizium acridum CQMa 102]EFY86135.1 aldolase [Metarhizium acridum CQMa 102]KAG8414774.1 hypothetical protein J3458_008684 [Metarhizium acridum]KAG8425771.1 hypothetical protein J3459_009692 [Metarhizium acridum]
MMRNTRTDEEAETEFEIGSLCRGPNQLKGIPKLPSFHEHREHIVVHRAAVFRNWARVGFTEGISGHIGVRDPGHPGLIWMNSAGEKNRLYEEAQPGIEHEIEMAGGVISAGLEDTAVDGVV